MKDAKYIGPVEGETRLEKYNRQEWNFFRFKTFYFEAYMQLPTDERYAITQRYHNDKPMFRDEFLKLAEETNTPVPQYILDGDMDPKFYVEEIYTRNPVWTEV